MNNQHANYPSFPVAIIAGAFTGIYYSLHKEDIFRTIVLAVIGALVSYLVTALLNEIKNRLKR